MMLFIIRLFILVFGNNDVFIQNVLFQLVFRILILQKNFVLEFFIGFIEVGIRVYDLSKKREDDKCENIIEERIDYGYFYKVIRLEFECIL